MISQLLALAGATLALTVTSARRSSSLPEVPTVAESGFKDFDLSTWYGLLAPAGTPAQVVRACHPSLPPRESLPGHAVQGALSAV